MGTTEISVSKTFGEIQELLAGMEVDRVTSINERGVPVGIMFSAKHPEGGYITFKVPAKVDSFYERMIKNMESEKVRGIRNTTKVKIREQASRTAWRLILRWLQVQKEMVDMGQADTMEVFLPYIIDKNEQTLYQRFQQNPKQLLLLGE
jgi:hypothetical protein